MKLKTLHVTIKSLINYAVCFEKKNWHRSKKQNLNIFYSLTTLKPNHNDNSIVIILEKQELDTKFIPDLLKMIHLQKATNNFFQSVKQTMSINITTVLFVKSFAI